MPDTPASAATPSTTPAASPATPSPAEAASVAAASPGANAAPANWRESLPPEYRENPAIKTIADIPTLTKGYIEAQSRLGNSIRIPSREAGPEDRAAFRKKVLEFGKDYGVMPIPGEGEDPAEFYAALGRPAKPEDYELPTFEDPDGEVDLSEAEALRPAAHKYGLTKEQFKGLVKEATEANMEVQREQMRRQQADAAALKKEWGAAHTIRMTQLQKFLEVNNAPAALVGAVKSGAIASESARWLYGIMETLGGETAEVASQGKGHGTHLLTPSEALERVSEVEKKMATIPQGSEEYNQLLVRRIELLRLAG